MRCVMQSNTSSMGNGNRVCPLESWSVKWIGLVLGIKDDTKFPRLENAIRRALRVIAAALVVKNGNVFHQTAPQAHADLQLVRFIVTLSLKRLNLRQGQQVNAFLFAHDNVVPAAIHRKAWFDTNETITTGLVRMRFHF